MILPEAANPLFLICFLCELHFPCLDPTKAHPINYIMGEFMGEYNATSFCGMELACENERALQKSASAWNSVKKNYNYYKF